MVAELVVQHGLPVDWDDLSRGAPTAASTAWIRLGAERFPEEYRSIVLRDDDVGQVAMVGAVLPRPPANTRLDLALMLSGGRPAPGLAADGPYPWHADDAAEAFPCLLLMYPDYCGFPVGASRSDPVWLRRFVASVVDWAAGAGMRSVGFLYLMPPAADALRAELARFGFAALPLIERCDLDVRWRDFDGYLASLPRKHGAEARRELRRLDDRGFVLGCRPLAAEEPDLLDLRCRLVAKYDGHPDPAREHRFLERIRTLTRPEDVTVFTVSHDSRTVGFSLFVQHDDEWTATLTGADYTDDSSFTYFANLFYQPAAMAPGKGVRVLAYGPGSVAAKRRRGCRLTLLHAAGLRLR